jgi:hypothetical protein
MNPAKVEMFQASAASTAKESPAPFFGRERGVGLRANTICAGPVTTEDTTEANSSQAERGPQKKPRPVRAGLKEVTMAPGW